MIRDLLLDSDEGARMQGHALLCALHPEFSPCEPDAYLLGYQNAAFDLNEMLAPPCVQGHQEWCQQQDWPLYIRGFAAFWRRSERIETLPGEVAIPLLDD